MPCPGGVIPSIMRRALLYLAAFTSFTLAALIIYAAGLPDINTLQPDVPAPDLTLTTLDGSSLSLGDLRGSPVVINFWATWCVPCRIEMPALQSLYNEFQDQGLVVLAINLDEPLPAVLEWVDSLELTFPILLDSRSDVAVAFGVRAPPATFVIAPDGMIVRVFYGPVTAGQLRDVLAAFLV